MSLLDKKIEDYISKEEDDQEIVFEYEDIYEYDFPYEEDVPEGEYFSRISDIREYRDRYKNSYYIVYYTVFQVIMAMKWSENYISEIPYHGICQKLEKQSIPYSKFCSSMYKATGKKKFSRDDIIGKTERFYLSYEKDGCIGEITNRRVEEVHPSWFDDD